MKELDFKVMVDEANLILEGLGQLSFAKVYLLVEKLQMQAKDQLRPPSQLDSAAVSETVGAPRVGGSSNGDVHG